MIAKHTFVIPKHTFVIPKHTFVIPKHHLPTPFMIAKHLSSAPEPPPPRRRRPSSVSINSASTWTLPSAGFSARRVAARHPGRRCPTGRATCAEASSSQRAAASRGCRRSGCARSCARSKAPLSTPSEPWPERVEPVEIHTGRPPLERDPQFAISLLQLYVYVCDWRRSEGGGWRRLHLF
jgi:hypothetical protein